MRAPRLRLPSRTLSSLPRTQLRRRHVGSGAASPQLLDAIKIPQTPSDFAFCFDIDGVLLRSATPIPGATEALQTLQANRIPFLLLTNGGGKHESERVAELSHKLSVPLDTSLFVQSHTPFSDLGDQENLKDKCVLIVGGDGAKCREVAEAYGYTNIVTPADIYAAHPEVWPFSKNFDDYYRSFARPLPRPINTDSPADSLKIDAVFVYNDPRDWGLDCQLLVDLMLSREGILGTLSSKNGDNSLPNCGFLQDGQPMMYFSNPDSLWAATYALPRLGQGGFRGALQGTWSSVTHVLSPTRQPVSMKSKCNVIGKPHKTTYEFSEKQLMKHRTALFDGSESPPLKTVYMVGDNPESDICGANSYRSKHGVQWVSILTRTGVWDGSPLTLKALNRVPNHIVNDVAQAVALGLKQSTLHQG